MRTPMRPSVGATIFGVIEIGLRGFDRGVVGVDRGLGLIDLGLLQIEVLLGLGVFADQRLEPIEILLRRDKRRFVLRLARLRLIERGLIEPRVDFGQHVAFVDALAFLEEHVLQLAVDLGVDARR